MIHIFCNVLSLVKRLTITMTPKKPIRHIRELTDKNPEHLPDIALAAIISYKKQNEVSDFMNYLLEALERNCTWLNNVIAKQNNFKCAFLTGAGPNRFQIQEIIYPSKEEEDIKLEVEFKDSEDYDKVAVAALFKLSNMDLDYLLKYIKTKLFDNSILTEDLLKGKALGISFAVLRPLSEKQYCVMERIAIGSSMKCMVPMKKRREEEKLFIGPPIKKTRWVV
ncbi:uncharacterized protein LOC128200549 [Galleria mellonella]|uniref:Uncharacterized protein LOC128200549 n=1 Tax=Galleria mellonella TaxID=7137 RepID=A0ABM3MFY4_GALME|nr:uncharacterized protein LOC128200549 [Galleria mellonella]